MVNALRTSVFFWFRVDVLPEDEIAFSSAGADITL